MEPDLDVEFIENADKRNYRVSFERIRCELGFQCHVGLETGMRGLQEALRRGLVKDYTEPVYNNHQTLLAHLRQANGHHAAPEAELLARQFSQKSIWWNPNQSNGHAAADGEAGQPVTNGKKAAARVAAAGA
jgi:hypothetical protein